LANVLGSKKADGVILTGCTISQIERKTEMSATGHLQTSRTHPTQVRFSLISAHWSEPSLSQLWAISGTMHRSKKDHLFDDLVRLDEQGGRHREPERFGSPHVDDQLKFGRLLYRQISRIGASENFIDVFCSPTQFP
jgi:hypothetical protein